MSSITDLIRKEIENLSTDATRTNVGTIATLADGVARVEGLSKVMYNEMVEFPGNVLGIALNLEEDSVGCVILGETSALKEGDEVDLNLIYFDHDKKRLQYKFEMIHKNKKYLASTIEILALYVDLEQRKVAEFEDEKTKIMDDFILKNRSKFTGNNLIFSDKLKK